ncbi:lysophospholipid acyltransferase family protein [Streptomyces turgidiscabies]|uniref:Acyltransferase n=1 Tax=Streptomyces turgidiscabies (strain Car8) TaxID=698760 RepID=L7F6E1_STRT8|nr:MULTISPECIES: lysophospholipid acyltransferase family protein [Streptomyces]ELP66684.1 acyltransferase [Streptomyces turgidiscabies Car8]MDX3498796.1 lysophospholipid acyltransferase family protein [Streptomyces turgidiscabies]GAQ74776.1 2-acyl-glycerophospho-ethanolamine acyltransferase [Streptomyces turgidiscabies]
MADAKVIPFDDDRSRAGAVPRPSRRRSGGSGRRNGEPAVVREVQPLPGRGRPQDDGQVTREQQPPQESQDQPGHPSPSPAPDGEDGGLERRIAGGLAFLRRRLTGDYEVDEFGYDAELTDQVLMSMVRPLYEKYFRVEVKGIENIPAEGGALIVANHSGTLPLDGLMMQVGVHDNHPAGRHLRLLAADLVFMLPVVNELARKAGHTLACAEDAERLLERGELVGVMPEGFKGIGKPFSERYKLQRFGRGGFVSTALRQGAPIIPCSIVGAEEIYPMIGNAKTLARVLGFPYFPITPTFPWLGPLGAVPLPTKWTIQFGEPIRTDGYPPEAAEDPMLMFNLTDQVREQIQHTLYKLLVQRRSVFF